MVLGMFGPQRRKRHFARPGRRLRPSFVRSFVRSFGGGGGTSAAAAAAELQPRRRNFSRGGGGGGTSANVRTLGEFPIFFVNKVSFSAFFQGF